jgi:hypothetical protein
MRLVSTFRDLLARFRAHRPDDLEREVDADDDARRRGTKPLDPAEGVQHPPHDPSTWAGGPL